VTAERFDRGQLDGTISVEWVFELTDTFEFVTRLDAAGGSLADRRSIVTCRYTLLAAKIGQ
jgi:hypothetical protein